VSDHPGSTTIEGNLSAVRERIVAAANRAGRDPGSITLVGVSKTMPAERVREAVEAGLLHIGENRVQEAVSKVGTLSSLTPSPIWHLIGHLQSNKARRAAEVFSWVQSIDREDLARRLDRAAGDLGKTLDVLIQVDVGDEPTKHGVTVDELKPLAEVTAALSHLRLQGLMTIPPLGEPETARPFFRRLREIRDGLQATGHELPELSMGMTNDFEVAVEEGATIIRVGRAIFGERPS
jgi:pyridoxal phosphate enzyme (YggS family)